MRAACVHAHASGARYTKTPRYLNGTYGVLQNMYEYVTR